VGTITLFTLAFIFSYDVESDNDYRQTLLIAILSAGWPCVALAIALMLVVTPFPYLRHAAVRLVVSGRGDALLQPWQRATERTDAASSGASLGNRHTGICRSAADAMRAHR
jgi:hypothetical protein